MRKSGVLFPCSNLRKDIIPRFFKKNNIEYKEIITYKPVNQDLSDLDSNDYEVIVFFTPIEVKSFFNNFPDFRPSSTQIAAWGPQTAKAMKSVGWKPSVQAPREGMRSLVDALSAHFRKEEKKSIHSLSNA